MVEATPSPITWRTSKEPVVSFSSDLRFFSSTMSYSKKCWHNICMVILRSWCLPKWQKQKRELFETLTCQSAQNDQGSETFWFQKLLAFPILVILHPDSYCTFIRWVCVPLHIDLAKNHARVLEKNISALLRVCAALCMYVIYFAESKKNKISHERNQDRHSVLEKKKLHLYWIVKRLL